MKKFYKYNTHLISPTRITYVIPLCRYFTSTNYVNLPKNNDQDNLIKEINKLEEKFNELDRDIEELNKEVVEEESYLNSDEEETQLSKLVKARELKKDEMVGDKMEERDQALFTEGNERKEASLALEQILAVSRKDAKTLAAILDQSSVAQDYQEKALDLAEKVDNLKNEAKQLSKRFHENDLPPISDPNAQDNSTRFPQDSSEVEQTEFYSFEPFDE